MVKENNASQQSQETTQEPVTPVSVVPNEQPKEEPKPKSIGKQIGIVLLIIAGIVIGIPFLLFIGCWIIVQGI